MDLFKGKFLKIILGILVLASFLRFYNLGEKPFVADEFLGVNTVYGYLQTGEWLRWDFNLEKPYDDKPYFKTIFDLDLWGGGEKTYTRAWIHNWQIATSLEFLPDAKEWSYRMVSAIWGVLGVLIIYIVSVKMTGRKAIGIISAILLAVSIDSIEFSRKVRMYIMFMPVFLLFSYFAFKFLESKRKSASETISKLKEKTGLNFLYFIPAFLFAFLSMHLHLLTANFAFILLVYFLAMGILSYRKNNKIKSKYLSYTVLLLFLGWAMSFFSKDFLAGLTWENHFSYLEKSFADYSNPFLAIGLILAGIYYLLKTKTKEGVFIASSYLTILLGSIFLWDRSAGSQYLFFAKPFQVILISAGILFIAMFLKNNLKKYANKTYIFSILIILLILPNFTYFFQEENTYTQTSSSPNPSYGKVFAYFTREKEKGDVLISRNFRNFYWRGSHTKTYSLGGERAGEKEKKLTKERLLNILKKNSSGWIIYSENDENFISKEAEIIIEENLEEVSNSSVRGPISIYRWR